MRSKDGNRARRVLLHLDNVLALALRQSKRIMDSPTVRGYNHDVELQAKGPLKRFNFASPAFTIVR